MAPLYPVAWSSQAAFTTERALQRGYEVIRRGLGADSTTSGHRETAARHRRSRDSGYWRPLLEGEALWARRVSMTCSSLTWSKSSYHWPTAQKSGGW